jgi:hypothetical protein
VRRTARRAGLNKRISPSTLRQAFITAALDAGVPLRDVQEAASHADPRTTMRYDRARVSLDRHATYIVAAYLAGAARSTTGVAPATDATPNKHARPVDRVRSDGESSAVQIDQYCMAPVHPDCHERAAVS